MKQIFYLILSFLVIVFLFIFSSAKTVFAATTTDPVACSLDSITVNGQTFLFVNSSNPIPQFQNFFLNMSCISTDVIRGRVDATLFVTVNGQLKNALLISGAGQATASIGPYDGLPGLLGPSYARYTVTTAYASMNTGGGLQIVTCSMSSNPCTFLVFGDGVRPAPTPTITPFTPNCPTFRAFNPNPPVVNQSFQLQYNLPSSGVFDGVYEFGWKKKDGTTGTTPLDKSTANAFGIWVGTFTFNQETTITLIQTLVPRNQPVECNQQTVFQGISSGGGGGTLVPGQNPCIKDLADGKVKCQTAFGNISTDFKEFTTRILQIAIGLAGAFALILLVRGSIVVLTSGGDPQKLNSGREIIIAAVVGLLFLIFSVLILRFIGFSLLGGIAGI